MSKITIIELNPGGVSIVQCLSCEGTGGRSWPHWHEPCGGTGILAIQHEGPLMVCSGCDGTGGKAWSHWHSACGGTGIVPAYGPWKILPRKLEK